MKKQAEIDKKTMDELVRERDILNKNCLKVYAISKFCTSKPAFAVNCSSMIENCLTQESFIN